MKCPHCGARGQEADFRCTNCNQMIKVEVKTTWGQIAIGAVFIALLMALGCALVYMDSNKVGIFEKNEPNNFNDFSWDQLASIARDMTITGSVELSLGEAKKHNFTQEDGTLRSDLAKEFTLADGTKATAWLVDLYHDPRSNGSGNAGMTFVVTVPVSQDMMNAAATNTGGWEASELRAKLAGEVLKSLPEDLQKNIVEVNKKTNNTGATSSPDAVTITADKLWALSFVELMGTQEGQQGYAEVLNAEGSQYALLADAGLKEKLLKDVAAAKELNWWLRSPNPEAPTQFFSAGTGTNTLQDAPLPMEANSKLSVVIGFCF